MVNAGRVLIIPKGTWSNLVTYEMLDLVTDGDIAYIAKQSSVGQKPSNDTAMTYWQPFGTAAKIATTSEPGLVMPDGTTITIDSTGLISVILGITGLTDVAITSLSNGQILQYDGSTSKWKNVSLGTAASRNATSSITSGSTDLIESGAVNSLKQTLANKQPKTLDTPITIAGTQQTTVEGALGGLNTALANTVNASSIAPVQTTLVASQEYKIGEQFYYQSVLYEATALISSGDTITIGGNCSAADDITTQISNLLKWNKSDPYSGSTSHNLPSKFNELLIKANLGSNVILTIFIPKDAIGTGNTDTFRNGYSDSSGTSAMVSFKVTTTTIQAITAVLNGANVLTGLSYILLYR